MEQVEVGALVTPRGLEIKPDLIPLKNDLFIRRGIGRHYKVSLLEKDGKVLLKLSDRNTNTPVLRDYFMSFEEAIEYLRRELGLFVFEA